MEKKDKFFDIISFVFVIILVLWFTQIDYSDLSFKNNTSPYLGILSAALFIFVMQFAKKNQKNK
ncbi:hypothetical protein [Tenacibaculum sp. IB213877]|uniref:hypothetical protein n=1 Tax=Tenacibaculum sp. IB213877 TaxID=3097351 RepID=UPI002A59D96B|nr:hypothetical protein [Tenacibaculum sp. IB213877]MDY0779695.1 hypothetical protein [Tenacibaculum sp. IB213877]